MARTRTLSLLCLLALAACDSSPAFTVGQVEIWRTLAIPSGGATTLSLRIDGGWVTGTGSDYGVMGRPTGSFTVTGTVTGSHVHLELRYLASLMATYEADYTAADQLEGTWTTPGGHSFARTFERAVIPA
jgi:hypothetical protein